MNTPRNLPQAANSTKPKSLHWLNTVERETNTAVGGKPIDEWLALDNQKGLADALLADDTLADKLFGNELFRVYYTRSGFSSKKSSVDWKSLV